MKFHEHFPPPKWRPGCAPGQGNVHVWGKAEQRNWVEAGTANAVMSKFQCSVETTWTFQTFWKSVFFISIC